MPDEDNGRITEIAGRVARLESLLDAPLVGRAVGDIGLFSWPADVGDGQVITAAHINSIRNGIFLWQGDINGNGFKLCNTGNIGIGTSDPLRWLHIVGSVEPGMLLENLSVSPSTKIGRLWQTFIDSATADYVIRGAPGGFGIAYDSVRIQGGNGNFTFKGGVGWDLGALPPGFIGTSINEGVNTIDIWVKYSTGVAKRVTLNLT